MFDQITQLVKQFGQDSVVKNPEVPNDHNDAVMADATESVTSGFQNALSGGNFQSIIDLFKGKGLQGGIAELMKNPMVAQIIASFTSKLTGKYNMSPAQASNVADNLIPNVMSSFVSRTQSDAPADSGFNLDSMIGSITGGKGFDLQGMIGQFTGGGSGDGKGINLQDMIGQFTGKADNNEQEKKDGSKETGGGLNDLVKGLFGN